MKTKGNKVMVDYNMKYSKFGWQYVLYTKNYKGALSRCKIEIYE